MSPLMSDHQRYIGQSKKPLTLTLTFARVEVSCECKQMCDTKERTKMGQTQTTSSKAESYTWGIDNAEFRIMRSW